MSKQSQILDEELARQPSWELRPEENIIWTGKPRPKYWPTLLQLWGFQEALTGPLFLLALALIYSIIKFISAYSTDDWVRQGLSLGTIILIVSIPEIIKKIKSGRINYTLTNQRVVFESWNKSVFTLTLSEINRVSYEVYKNGKGIIHLIPNQPLKFRTRDFFAFKKRDYPTFESIDDALEVFELIEKARMKP